MKKKLVGALLAACFGTGLVMSSVAGEVTVDQVLENYRNASAQTNEINATVEGVADITLSMPDQDMSMGIKGNMNMNMAATVDPLAAEVQADMSGSAMGEGGSLNMHMYIKPADDGTIPVYIGVDEGEGLEWAVTTIDGETAEKLQSLTKGGDDFSGLPINFELGEGTVDVNGTACYALVANMTWDDIVALYNSVIEQAGDAVPTDSLPDQDTLDMVGSMLSGLVLSFEIDVDTETYLPMRAHLDLEGSDWVTLSAMIASLMGATDDEGNLMSLSLDVSSLYIDYLYDYSTPVSIEVPQDVIDNATDLGSASDLTEEAAGMVEGTAGGE